MHRPLTSTAFTPISARLSTARPAPSSAPPRMTPGRRGAGVGTLVAQAEAVEAEEALEWAGAVDSAIVRAHRLAWIP